MGGLDRQLHEAAIQQGAPQQRRLHLKPASRWRAASKASWLTAWQPLALPSPSSSFGTVRPRLPGASGISGFNLPEITARIVCGVLLATAQLQGE